MNEIRKASELIGNIFNNIEKNEFQQSDGITFCWKETVGEKISAHSYIMDLHKGILHVEVSHPGWIQLIQMRRKEIIDNLKNRFPNLEFNSIAFHLSSNEKTNKPERKVTREEMLAKIEEREAKNIVTPNENSFERREIDDTLKKLFKNLEKTIRQSNKK